MGAAVTPRRGGGGAAVRAADGRERRGRRRGVCRPGRRPVACLRAAHAPRGRSSPRCSSTAAIWCCSTGTSATAARPRGRTPRRAGRSTSPRCASRTASRARRRWASSSPLQLGWTLPDAIIYPTGGGTGLIGMWKAFGELRDAGWVQGALPRMYTVQSTRVRARGSGLRRRRRDVRALAGALDGRQRAPRARAAGRAADAPRLEGKRRWRRGGDRRQARARKRRRERGKAASTTRPRVARLWPAPASSSPAAPSSPMSGSWSSTRGRAGSIASRGVCL